MRSARKRLFLMFLLIALWGVVAVLTVVPVSAQSDPGVRTSTGVNAGQPLSHLSQTPGAPQFFSNALARFQEVDVVQGGQFNGLGPRFNLNQCSACHSQPDVGGTSPKSTVFPFIGDNPEFEVINNGIVNPNFNKIPFFVLQNGPVREARFPFFINPNGTLSTTSDGGVHDMYTISGRSDAGNCVIKQPDFDQANRLNDIIFRIPTPTFGGGFIENIGEDTLLTNLTNQGGNSFGISGTFNRNGNDGTISRFGWKAQNKSLMLFSGEAYNVEMGVTNELFQNERPNPDEEQNLSGLPNSSTNNCLINPTPEDKTNFLVTSNPDQATQNAEVPSDVVMFAIFMRFLDQPTPVPPGQGYSTATTTVSAASIARGRQGFSIAGCSICHTPAFTTDHSSFNVDLDQKAANLFSDLEIHHMGGLADNVTQGAAGGDQFRSAPLWGIGQRIFFLHDGRTQDLLTAIQDHCLPSPVGGSEACISVQTFNNLPPTTPPLSTVVSQQDVLNFLRSL